MKELKLIQQTLKAPKNQYNSFGKYKYRSLEDIVEAVKPLCKKNDCLFTLSDKLVQIGDRYYIEATAKIVNSEGVSEQCVGYAREEETKKGMDASQITGTASSYARKYACNGLFLIDDNKDSDITNTQNTNASEVAEEKQKQRVLNHINKSDSTKTLIRCREAIKENETLILYLSKYIELSKSIEELDQIGDVPKEMFDILESIEEKKKQLK